MTIKLIELHHTFDKPETKSGLTVDVGGEIIDGQAIVVLRGIKTEFQDDDPAKFLKFKAKATNIRAKGHELEYNLEFDLRDEDHHVGKAEIDLLAIADVDVDN